jgi:hypothetical protein
MAKRDKYGRFIKGKVVKKKAFKTKPKNKKELERSAKSDKKVTVSRPQKKVTNTFSLNDLYELIESEVAHQIRNWK